MSSAGIKVYNADGSLQFDSTARLFMTLDEFDTGKSAGSRTFVLPAGSNTVTTSQNDGGTEGTSTPPTVSVSGNTVSWTAGTASSRVRVVAF